LGIWHFIITKRGGKNTLGERTIDQWCPSDVNRKERKYSGDIGSGITRKITLREVDDMPPSVEGFDSMNSDKGNCNAHTRKTLPDTDPKRITVNNYGTVENQKFVSIETMNGDIHL